MESLPVKNMSVLTEQRTLVQSVWDNISTSHPLAEEIKIGALFAFLRKLYIDPTECVKMINKFENGGLTCPDGREYHKGEIFFVGVPGGGNGIYNDHLRRYIEIKLHEAGLKTIFLEVHGKCGWFAYSNGDNPVENIDITSFADGFIKASEDKTSIKINVGATFYPAEGFIDQTSGERSANTQHNEIGANVLLLSIVKANAVVPLLRGIDLMTKQSHFKVVDPGAIGDTVFGVDYVLPEAIKRKVDSPNRTIDEIISEVESEFNLMIQEFIDQTNQTTHLTQNLDLIERMRISREIENPTSTANVLNFLYTQVALAHGLGDDAFTASLPYSTVIFTENKQEQNHRAVAVYRRFKEQNLLSHHRLQIATLP
jgi:hypothetical protein